MREIMADLKRSLIWLFEAFAPACGPDWFVHQSLFECVVVPVPSEAPPEADRDDDQPAPRPKELSWQLRDGQWRLAGCVLPAHRLDEV